MSEAQQPSFVGLPRVTEATLCTVAGTLQPEYLNRIYDVSDPPLMVRDYFRQQQIDLSTDIREHLGLAALEPLKGVYGTAFRAGYVLLRRAFHGFNATLDRQPGQKRPIVAPQAGPIYTTSDTEMLSKAIRFWGNAHKVLVEGVSWEHVKLEANHDAVNAISLASYDVYEAIAHHLRPPVARMTE